MKRYLEMTNLPFKVGQVLTVTGVPNRDGDRFSINVGHSVDDIALHIDVRFNYDNSSKQVLINSCRSGTWDKNHKIPEEFPFKYDEKFKVRHNLECIIEQPLVAGIHHLHKGKVLDQPF
ncbi:beta-galactoside-binding lectin-like isoform X3 [Hypomesus transpacificus]|uniref:beta-galactoside-binding lectin-like isoform X3 n=1 Tax=Hypomesus transpacificus TaxID=137520 RepID=UPI001F078052|nr:beta-galactoside-binding lectin-like isoform X3 [Hypomesus transpacificus]